MLPAGVSAGYALDPLLTLVISETLQRDVGSGVKVALAPIITDLPIIIRTQGVRPDFEEIRLNSLSKD